MKKLLIIVAFSIFVVQFPTNTFANGTSYWNHISFELDLFDWKEVNILLPKYKIFNVIDLESGKSFVVQRRAGRDHADVQPLTRRDTSIMKEIYSGKWSWKRRAILVQVNDYLIPGSMHGMPHGAGALSNNFPGHFCIHFFGSTTHTSDSMDFSHKLMILKAYGELDQYIFDATVHEQIENFIEAINQQDQSILDLVFTDSWKENNILSTLLEDIDSIKIKKVLTIPTETDGLLVVKAQVKVTTYSKSTGLENAILHLQLSRTSLLGQWEVHHELVSLDIE